MLIIYRVNTEKKNGSLRSDLNLSFVKRMSVHHKASRFL